MEWGERSSKSSSSNAQNTRRPKEEKVAENESEVAFDGEDD